ncbi:MAG: hypothetical protein AAF570_15495 [Bacteroidota bacterium]
MAGLGEDIQFSQTANEIVDHKLVTQAGCREDNSRGVTDAPTVVETLVRDLADVDFRIAHDRQIGLAPEESKTAREKQNKEYAFYHGEYVSGDEQFHLFRMYKIGKYSGIGKHEARFSEEAEIKRNGWEAVFERVWGCCVGEQREAGQPGPDHVRMRLIGIRPTLKNPPFNTQIAPPSRPSSLLGMD